MQDLFVKFIYLCISVTEITAKQRNIQRAPQCGVMISEAILVDPFCPVMTSILPGYFIPRPWAQKQS